MGVGKGRSKWEWYLKGTDCKRFVTWCLFVGSDLLCQAHKGFKFTSIHNYFVMFLLSVYFFDNVEKQINEMK